MMLDIKTITIFPVRWGVRSLILSCAAILIACGGGGSSKRSQPASAASSAVNFSTSSNGFTGEPIKISGRVTYDFVPHNPNNYGLDYAATTARAGRGLVVELIDNQNQVVASTITDNAGNYSVAVEPEKLVKVRVKAQALRTSQPSWNFKVTDNTNANSLYAMEGNLLAANRATAVRDLHASSGWEGTGYTKPRVAAPFAIIDSVLTGVDRIVAADSTVSFPPLDLRWSLNNKPVEGDRALGEIGTTFYDSARAEIYILGDQNNDTDEYDQHVILHEWGHYVEREFSRSDSIGGDHVYGDKLDMRVAMSEGFANAFSAMMLNDPNYRDASGSLQGSGFLNKVDQKNNTSPGWYSESSLQSILYNFYISGNGKTPGDFSDIFKVIHSASYFANEAMISIYVFAETLRNLVPMHAAEFDSLLLEQNIAITNSLGEGEINSGGRAVNLPIYRRLTTDNSAVNVCSSNKFGSYNKLGNAKFLYVDVLSEGNYQLTATEFGTNTGDSDPDIYLYRSGNLVDFAERTTVDEENLSRTLPAGRYVLEIVDDRVKNIDGINEIEACFDVRAQRVN